MQKNIYEPGMNVFNGGKGKVLPTIVVTAPPLGSCELDVAEIE